MVFALNVTLEQLDVRFALSKLLWEHIKCLYINVIITVTLYHIFKGLKKATKIFSQDMIRFLLKEK